MRKAGLSPRTVSNRWLAFHAFLKHFNITGLTKRMDAPRYVVPEPQCYEKADLEKFFVACNDNQRVLFQFPFAPRVQEPQQSSDFFYFSLMAGLTFGIGETFCASKTRRSRRAAKAASCCS